MQLIRLLVVLMSLLCSPSIWASNQCDDVIIDGAKILKDGSDKVSAAASRLVNAGAAVRVRTVEDRGSFPTIDKMHEAMVEKCPSWQAKDGGTRNNLVVVWVSKKTQETALKFGGQWRVQLDKAWPQIVSGTMNPRFRDGDFSGGIAKGLGDVTTLITASSVARSGPTTIQQASDYSGLWTVFGWIVGLSALGALSWFGYMQYRRREVASAAQQKAKIARGRCSDAILSIESDLDMLRLRSRSSRITLSDVNRAQVMQLLVDADNSYQRGSRAFSSLNGASNPDNERWTEAQYLNAESAFSEAYRHFEAAQAGMTRAKRLMDENPQDAPPPSRPAPEAAPSQPRSTPASEASGHTSQRSAAQQSQSVPGSGVGYRGRVDRQRYGDPDSTPDVIVAHHSPSVVVIDDDPSPVVVQRQSRPVIYDDPYDRPAPTREREVRQEESGGTVSFGSSREASGGGTVDFGSSREASGGGTMNWDSAPVADTGSTNY